MVCGPPMMFRALKYYVSQNFLQKVQKINIILSLKKVTECTYIGIPTQNELGNVHSQFRKFLPLTQFTFNMKINLIFVAVYWVGLAWLLGKY